jgi:hypothetical protein
MIFFFALALVLADPGMANPTQTCAPGANCSQNQTGGTSVGSLNLFEKPDRHLDSPGSIKLRSMLPDPKNTGSVQLSVLAGDGSQERSFLAAEISAFLKSLGYNISGDVGWYMPFGLVRPGVAIEVGKENPPTVRIFINGK